MRRGAKAKGPIHSGSERRTRSAVWKEFGRTCPFPVFLAAAILFWCAIGLTAPSVAQETPGKPPENAPPSPASTPPSGQDGAGLRGAPGGSVPAQPTQPPGEHGPASASSAGHPGPHSGAEAPPAATPPSALWAVLSALGAGAACGFVLGFIAGRRSGIWSASGPGRKEPGQEPRQEPGEREAFRRHYASFQTLYAELWRAAESANEPESDRADTLKNWRGMLDLVGDPVLLRAWQRIERSTDGTRARAKAWLQALEGWGLQRMLPTEIEISADTLRKFHISPRRESGRAKVVEPCWTFEGAIVQKGYALAEAGKAA